MAGRPGSPGKFPRPCGNVAGFQTAGTRLLADSGRPAAGTEVAPEDPSEGTTTMTKEIKTILVPIDFSANAARALDYAQMLAKRFGAAIHLVHVCEVPSMATASMDAYAIAYSDWSQRLADEAERELTRVAAGVHDAKVST